MGNATLTALRGGRLESAPGAKIQGTTPYILDGLLTMSSSYATNGDTLDLSSYFDEIHEVMVEDDLNYGLNYVAGSGANDGKVKAYQSKTVAHTHSLLVKGAQSAGQLVQVSSSILGKSPVGLANGRITGPVSYVANGTTLDLSATFNAIPNVVINVEEAGYRAAYVPGTIAADGKVKFYKDNVASGRVAGPASYSGGGTVLDLSATFKGIPKVVVVCEAAGYQASYVPGTGASDGTIKVYKENVTSGQVAGPASYVSGGFILDLSASFSGIPNVVVSLATIGDYVASYVPGTGATDGKVAVTVMSTGVEVAGAVNLSAVNFDYVARVAPSEVINTTNLSGVNFEYVATATEDEPPNATNLSAIHFQYLAIGAVDVAGDATLTGGTNNNQNNSASAAAAEVTVATNLSTVSVPIRITGKQKSS